MMILNLQSALGSNKSGYINQLSDFKCLATLLFVFMFSTVVNAEDSLYPQLSSKTAQNIAGNWQVTLVNKEDKQLHRYFIRMEAPYTSYCERISEHVCRYRVRDNAKGKWESAYVAAGNTFHRSFKINSPTLLDYEHAYGVVGDWGANSKISFSGNKGTGKWRYRDEDGVESWDRLLPTIDKVLFYPAARSEFKGQRHSGISQSGSIGEVTGVYDKWWWGPKNNAPGNRPVFYFEIYGKNLWGFHVIDMKESIGFGVPQCDRYLYKDNSEKLKDVVGLRCWAHIWPGVTNGTKIIRFDNHEIPFDLNIDGLAQPIKIAVEIPDEWRYRDAMGEEDGDPKVDLNSADYAWKLKSNGVKDWPVIKLNITGDDVSDLNPNKIIFANNNLKLLSKKLSADAIELVVTLKPQTKHGQTSLTIDQRTLPFSFEYGGGFPDLAISNQTADPNSPFGGANMNLTNPLHTPELGYKELVVSIKNEGALGVDGFDLALTGEVDDYWVYPQEINVCSEKESGCKPCTKDGSSKTAKYLCDEFALNPGEDVLASVHMTKSTAASKTEDKQCGVTDSIEFKVSGRQENTIESAIETLYGNNKTNITLDRDRLDVASVQFEGISVLPDENGEVVHKFKGSKLDASQYLRGLVSVHKRRHFTFGKTYPIDRVTQGGLFRLRVNLHRPACANTKVSATLKLTRHSSGESTYTDYPLIVSKDGMSLIDEHPFIAISVGNEYQLSFKQHQSTMIVEELPRGILSIKSKKENGRNHRVVKHGEDYIVTVNLLDTVIPPNVWVIQLAALYDHEKVLNSEGLKDFFLIEKINQTTFMREATLWNPFEGDIKIAKNANFKPADKDLDILKVVSEETDLYELDGLFFSEKGTNFPIDIAITNNQLVVQAMFKQAAPSNSAFILRLVRGESEITSWQVDASRRNDNKLLVSNVIDLAELSGKFGLQEGDIIQASWEENKDHIAVINVQAQSGKLQSLSIKQDGKEVQQVELDKPFTTELDFESVVTDKLSVFYEIESVGLTKNLHGLQKSKPLKLIDKEKAIYSADFLVNEYGRLGNSDEALSGDKLKVSFHDKTKEAEFESNYQDDNNSIIFAYFDPNGDLADIKGTLVAQDPKQSIRFVSNRFIEVPTGSYIFDIKVDNCCHYRASIEINDATPERVEIPQLASLAVTNNPAKARVLAEKTNATSSDGWELLKQEIWSIKDELVIPVGSYQFVFKLPAPSNATKGSGDTSVTIGENLLAAPSVSEISINVFDASGAPYNATVTMDNQGRWDTGKKVSIFTEKDLLSYYLTSNTIQIPSYFSSPLKNKVDIFLGEKIFHASRTGIDEKRVCREKGGKGSESSTGWKWPEPPVCMAIKYNKVYSFFPGDYYLEEISTYPRSYHTQEELIRIATGRGQLKQKRTIKPFTVKGKQRAKALKKAPATVGG